MYINNRMHKEQIHGLFNGITSSSKNERTIILRNRSDTSEKINDSAINASQENHPTCFHLHQDKPSFI